MLPPYWPYTFQVTPWPKLALAYPIKDKLVLLSFLAKALTPRLSFKSTVLRVAPKPPTILSSWPNCNWVWKVGIPANLTAAPP